MKGLFSFNLQADIPSHKVLNTSCSGRALLVLASKSVWYYNILTMCCRALSMVL